ncbi:MAG: hypothetical protein AB8G95_09850, partial [Anaerolineae bacterium]
YGRYADANEIYALAETAAKKLGSQEQLVKTLIRWSEMGLEQSDYDRVWSRLETALPIAYQLEDDSAVGQVKYLQGYVLQDQGEYSKAEKLVAESICLFGEQLDILSQAKATDLLGWIYYESDERTDRSKQATIDALKLFNKSEEVLEKTSTYRLQASIAYREKAYKESENHAINALSIAEAFNSSGEVMASLYLLLAIYGALDQYESAKKAAIRALHVAQQIGNGRYEGMIQHEFSAILIKSGDLNRAKEITEKNLKIFEHIEDRRNYGFALRQMGDIYAELKNHEMSQKHWQMAQAVAKHTQNDVLLLQMLERLGKA